MSRRFASFPVCVAEHEVVSIFTEAKRHSSTPNPDPGQPDFEMREAFPQFYVRASTPIGNRQFGTLGTRSVTRSSRERPYRLACNWFLAASGAPVVCGQTPRSTLNKDLNSVTPNTCIIMHIASKDLFVGFFQTTLEVKSGPSF